MSDVNKPGEELRYQDFVMEPYEFSERTRLTKGMRMIHNSSGRLGQETISTGQNIPKPATVHYLGRAVVSARSGLYDSGVDSYTNWAPKEVDMYAVQFGPSWNNDSQIYPAIGRTITYRGDFGPREQQTVSSRILTMGPFPDRVSDGPTVADLRPADEPDFVYVSGPYAEAIADSRRTPLQDMVENYAQLLPHDLQDGVIQAHQAQ